jgi:hypothetical protein
MWASEPPSTSVLDQGRKPLGYVDVARLKAKWEAGEAHPVGTRIVSLLPFALAEF